MESISVLDMFSIGIGPSSSHTLGPWRACMHSLEEIRSRRREEQPLRVRIHLFGSLSLTGKGHATDKAVMLALSGMKPETATQEEILRVLDRLQASGNMLLGGVTEIPFDPDKDIEFRNYFLPEHANGMQVEFEYAHGEEVFTYYSIGGGFITDREGRVIDTEGIPRNSCARHFATGKDVLEHCLSTGLPIAELCLSNELEMHGSKSFDMRLKAVWEAMLGSVFEGCHTAGELPGGLRVRRRAAGIYEKLKGEQEYTDPESWIASIRSTKVRFRQIFRWVACWAISVNEVNAAMGRVVTAPTNGSAGVIPAVLMYYLCIEDHRAGWEEIKKFLLVSGLIGSLFKQGATLSAAMGGCQAEIGVSSAMAAAGLTELLGGTPAQVLMASEIAMEHHLGLTCDPIAGLVQIPCIERNSMGAIKAIQAAELALDSDPSGARVSLDEVIRTMWSTAQDMNRKYKETSEGGLAVAVLNTDC